VSIIDQVCSVAFWNGAMACAVLHTAASFAGRRTGRWWKRRQIDGHKIPRCWGCNGLGFIVQPEPQTRSVRKHVCPVCKGECFTTLPRMRIGSGIATPAPKAQGGADV
jgi:hypothetical protein